MSNTEWNVLLASCPSRTPLARIANKWTAMIVSVLSEDALRFGDIKAKIEGISGKVLTETLRALERDGLVSREVYSEIPPKVEYQLTPLGRTLIVPLTALKDWVESHTDEVIAAQQRYDAREDS